jgi:uncharacterized membrane protein HdeD (DUF308 family)
VDKEVDVKTFAKALESGTKVAYGAVSVPKEGTILTVIRMMGEYAVIFMGAWLLVSGIQNMLLIRSSHRKWKCFFAGLIAIISGIFFIFAPFMGIAALSWIFSMLFFVSGAMMLASGLNSACCNN